MVFKTEKTENIKDVLTKNRQLSLRKCIELFDLILLSTILLEFKGEKAKYRYG